MSKNPIKSLGNNNRCFKCKKSIKKGALIYYKEHLKFHLECL